jgi:hypothetical protein
MKGQVDSYDFSAMFRKSETLPRKSKIIQIASVKKVDALRGLSIKVMAVEYMIKFQEGKCSKKS